MSKGRAIFAWITRNIAYDTKSFFSGKYPSMAAKAVLKRRSGVCAGYANLFNAMGKIANLECSVISGYAKGYGFKPG
jgi:transglutaminase/protease-like cytokinesis protein 3